MMFTGKERDSETGRDDVSYIRPFYLADPLLSSANIWNLQI